MANMNFGVNILPKTDNTYSLGNSDYKWNIFANQINGTDVSSFLTSHQDISGKVSGPSSATANNVALFDGTTGKLIKDSGFTIGKSVPSDAIFTDTTYTFDGTYNASSNKAATVSTVTSAISALNGNLNNTTPAASKTLTAFSQTDGIVSATFGNISITKSQISDLGTIGAAAEKAVDSSISAASTSTNLPTSAAVASFVEGKGYTTNTGTITGITMNGVSKGTSGTIDLGTVITAHQDISGKMDTNPVVTGTGTAGQAGSSSKAYIPAKWTFNLEMTPVEGDIITIKVPVAGVSSGVWISVDNGSHYYPIAVNNKTRLTTQYAINNHVTLIYQTGLTITTYGTTEAGAAKGSSTADLQIDRWCVLNYYDANTTYTNVALGQGYGTCDTSASTVAKEVTLASYALTANGIVSVRFTYDVPASATLNINAKGAKAIYYRGSVLTDGIIKAGDVATFIYNTYYHLIAIDRSAGLKSLTAANNGTTESLVTTGEKYTWNNKYSKPSGGIPASDLASGVGLPAVTSSDNDKFLRVVEGAWAVTTVASANGVSF